MDKTSYYLERINKVIDYIEANLERTIPIAELADIARFSAFHFHHIFRSFTDEALYQFVTRLRLERSAAQLLTSNKSITEIAFAYGFNDSATFSRAFRKHFKMSASDFKKNKNSKIHQDYKLPHSYNITMNDKQAGLIEPFHIEEKHLPAMQIAYARHTGAYAGDAKVFQSLYKQLKNWAQVAGFSNLADAKQLVIYHDPLGITQDDKLRISLGVENQEKVPVAGQIGELTIAQGQYIACSFELGTHDYGNAWKQVYRNILPQRGLEPADGHCFELYAADCYKKETNTSRVDIYLPIKQ